MLLLPRKKDCLKKPRCIMKKHCYFTGLIVVLLFLAVVLNSGCVEYLEFTSNTVSYEASPTAVQYDLGYGYNVNTTGEGDYEISYLCDLPEVQKGWIASPSLLYQLNNSRVTRVNNSFIEWKIEDKDQDSYRFGINTSVHAESLVVSDLSGSEALSIDALQILEEEIVNQFCGRQAANGVTYINPDHSLVRNTALNVVEQLNTTNSFLMAKSLFMWLKQHTDYDPHVNDTLVQPANKTIMLQTGDCDDLSFLYISLCRSVGIPARFIRGYLVRNTSGTGEAIPHVWVEVFVGGTLGDNGWIPVECACPSKDLEIQVHQNYGVEDASHVRLFTDDGSNESMNLTVSGFFRIKKQSSQEITADSFVNVSNYAVMKTEKLTVNKETSIRIYE